MGQTIHGGSLISPLETTGTAHRLGGESSVKLPAGGRDLIAKGKKGS